MSDTKEESKTKADPNPTRIPHNNGTAHDSSVLTMSADSTEEEENPKTNQSIASATEQKRIKPKYGPAKPPQLPTPPPMPTSPPPPLPPLAMHQREANEQPQVSDGHPLQDVKGLKAGDFKFGDRLGQKFVKRSAGNSSTPGFEGGEAMVFKAVHRDHPKFEVAVKMMLAYKFTGDPDRSVDQLEEVFSREFEIPMQLSHANVAPILTHFIDKPTADLQRKILPHKVGRTVFIVMQVLPFSLRNAIELRRSLCLPFRVAEVLRIASHVASALEYLESKRVRHVDLTDANILIDGKTIKNLSDSSSFINDFGHAFSFMDLPECGFRNHMQQSKQAAPGHCTPMILPPERKQKFKVDELIDFTKCDIFAFGILLSSMMCPDIPPLDREQKLKPDWALPRNYLIELQHLTRQCLDPLPANRPDAKEVVETLNHIYSSNTMSMVAEEAAISNAMQVRMMEEAAWTRPTEGRLYRVFMEDTDWKLPAHHEFRVLLVGSGNKGEPGGLIHWGKGGQRGQIAAYRSTTPILTDTEVKITIGRVPNIAGDGISLEGDGKISIEFHHCTVMQGGVGPRAGRKNYQIDGQNGIQVLGVVPRYPSHDADGGNGGRGGVGFGAGGGGAGSGLAGDGAGGMVYIEWTPALIYH